MNIHIRITFSDDDDDNDDDDDEKKKMMMMIMMLVLTIKARIVSTCVLLFYFISLAYVVTNLS